MKIDLFNVEEFIKINNLQEVTSHVMFQRGDVPHPQGLVSNEIFGITTRSRKTTFAYISLGKPYFHPLAYKALTRIFRNIDKIINGEHYYVITENGQLKLDNQNGETGIDFLYKNWEKIKWEKDPENPSGMRNERIDMLSSKPKNELFMKYQIVIPAFYRDIKSTSSGGETDNINNLYGRLIRSVSENKDDTRFDFQFHATDYNIQHILVSIYNYCKQKIEKKQGLIRKYLMGKNVDYCTRTVITAPVYHGQRPEDVFSDFQHAGIPISQVCSLCYPFVYRYVKQFFETELFDKKYMKNLYDPKSDRIVENDIEIESPEKIYNDKFIEKLIAQFIKDQECRFNLLPVQTTSGKTLYMVFSGKKMDATGSAEMNTIVTRPMTWTDLLYVACRDAVKGKHCIITRYPLLDEFGLFIANIRVASTTKTEPVMINGELDPFYPSINIKTPRSEIGAQFIDSVSFSNSYLEGLEGDYDGDQVTVKIIFTQEANEECNQVMNRKSYFINSAGNNIRVIGKEAAQTFYVLTKEPYGVGRQLTREETFHFTHMDPKDMTFDWMVDMFGYTVDIRDGNRDKSAGKPKYHPTDTLVIGHADYPIIRGKDSITTTLGRLIFNKILVEGLGFQGITDYINETLFAGRFKAFDRNVTDNLKDDKITVKQMIDYINTRDWFGLQMHAVVTTSFTIGVLKTPKSVQKRKEELFKIHEKELAEGNAAVMEDIEKELVKMMQDELKGDIGLDLYQSGARGSIGNHMKNINITRGAVYNPVTGKYDIVKNGLLDGLDKKDIPTHSNVIVTGSFPKAVGTAFSGYLSKELLAGMQTEVLADPGSDCGTPATIFVQLTNKNKRDYMYRYIVIGTNLVELTNDNIDKFVGKTVKLRTPMFCRGIGKERHICSKCAGEFYYLVGKRNIGLSCSRVAESTKQLNLQKFHDNTINTAQIDVSTMLM